MTPEVEAEIKAFVKERDEMLLACDIDLVRAFHAKHNPGLPEPSDEVAWLMLHKARTAARSLPREERVKSKKWLTERGSASMDDGDLADA